MSRLDLCTKLSRLAFFAAQQEPASVFVA
ncbi:hypothetical protein A3768_0148 [Ralstonia solanacearum]|nr:hypothetical protein A3768_0148 [Ralstonia solanacearum]